uniref:Uncharacterized protein AlNc14C163G7830 n=1 Tax=Albugo laibachii Nc14 TaxID=890382 RepID=F0WMZ3_9STRA|nr:conserved hypothetical protein [Albugo laibachii Nc14]|eukprot:CCA22680.1 conserved hypothetical protein [Albugo laibachii Nc14]
MGRRQRHSAKPGKSSVKKRTLSSEIKRKQADLKDYELRFYDDPSDGQENTSNTSEKSESDSEQEVLELDPDDDMDEELQDLQIEKEELERMGSKWGNAKENFYSADYGTSDEEAAGREEEEAALELQRKQAELVDEEDYGMEDAEEDPVESEAEDEIIDEEAQVERQLAGLPLFDPIQESAKLVQVPRNFDGITKKDKLKVLKRYKVSFFKIMTFLIKCNRSSPELFGLMNELKLSLTIVKDQLIPAIHKIKEMRKVDRSCGSGLRYLVVRQNLLLHYINNISLYLLLRSEGKSVQDHPVLDHILCIKRQIDELAAIDERVDDQLTQLLDDSFDVDAFVIEAKMNAAARKTSMEKKKSKTQDVKDGESTLISTAEKKEAEAFYEAAVRENRRIRSHQTDRFDQPVLESSEEEIERKKRGATHQIVKNKGLKAHKSKLNRNPRVKKRMQYEKAVIRRRGQVRDIRKGEAGQYGGERTGIKANLTRSRKIRT